MEVKFSRPIIRALVLGLIVSGYSQGGTKRPIEAALVSRATFLGGSTTSSYVLSVPYRDTKLFWISNSKDLGLVFNQEKLPQNVRVPYSCFSNRDFLVVISQGKRIGHDWFHASVTDGDPRVTSVDILEAPRTDVSLATSHRQFPQALNRLLSKLNWRVNQPLGRSRPKAK